MTRPIKFHYIRNKYDRPIATVAFRRDDNGFEFTVAYCNAHDNFCKKIGRAIAGGRLEKNVHVRRVELLGNQSFSDSFNSRMESLVPAISNFQACREMKVPTIRPV